MRLRILTLLTTVAINLYAQDHIPRELLDDTLGKVGNEVILVKDFVSIYDKSSFNDPNKYTYQSLREYWDLYVNFRRKVQEAKALRLDTVPGVKSEYEMYVNQLANMYINNKLINDSLARIAYERMLKNVHLSYILLVGKNQDSLREVATKILQEARARKPWRELVKKYSADTIRKDGRLGWYSAFQLIPAIEDAVYHAKKGDVLGPFAIGQNMIIVRVDSFRKNPGQVLTAHIFIPHTKIGEASAKKLIEEIYARLEKGESFEDLARQFSYDRTTSQRGGQYKWFYPGETMPEYEAVAFSLNPGEITKEPVKTPKGYYIIKVLDRRDVPPFEEIAPMLKEQVRRERIRFRTDEKLLMDKYREKLGFKEYPKRLKKLVKILDDSILYRKPTSLPCNKFSLRRKLFVLAGEKYRLSDLCQFIMVKWRPMRNKTLEETVQTYYRMFVDLKTREALKEKLSEWFPEYQALLREYYDGILLFEVMDRMVWKKALQDSIGLQKFFEENRERFGWTKKAKVIYWYGDTSVLRDVQKYLSEPKYATLDPDSIKKLVLAKHEGKTLTFVRSTLLPDMDDLPFDINQVKAGFMVLEVKQGVSPRLIYVEEVKPVELADVKGKVLSQYQQYLENQWLSKLAQKYPATLNEEVLRSLAIDNNR
ncbi:MAG: hypothetical protein GXO48_04675 [Chlorobi bacterium]|nr:hypothetical protein [Chlorobiota bacterium]